MFKQGLITYSVSGVNGFVCCAKKKYFQIIDNERNLYKIRKALFSNLDLQKRATSKTQFKINIANNSAPFLFSLKAKAIFKKNIKSKTEKHQISVYSKIKTIRNPVSLFEHSIRLAAKTKKYFLIDFV